MNLPCRLLQKWLLMLFWDTKVCMLSLAWFPFYIFFFLIWLWKQSAVVGSDLGRVMQTVHHPVRGQCCWPF